MGLPAPSDKEIVEFMATAAYDAFSRRPGAWARAKPPTKESFRAEQRAVLAALRARGYLRREK